jgi:glutamine amidotransferase
MIKADKRENVIMIASEPLTFERSEWMEVKTNTMIVITPKVSLYSVFLWKSKLIAKDECTPSSNH